MSRGGLLSNQGVKAAACLMWTRLWDDAAEVRLIWWIKPLELHCVHVCIHSGESENTYIFIYLDISVLISILLVHPW